VPIVVRADHDLIDLGVGSLIQHLSRKARPVWEIETGKLPPGIHVLDPLVHVVATWAHFFITVGIDIEVLGRLARHCVQPEISAPQVAEIPLLDPVVLFDHPRGQILVPGRDVSVEHVRRFGNVIIDADQNQIFGFHKAKVPESRPSAEVDRGAAGWAPDGASRGVPRHLAHQANHAW
jgi:hypothetical protein